jgi:hypothetical protein
MRGSPTFLSRWSRLKRETEARRSAEGQRATAHDANLFREARTKPDLSTVAELTPEELAALPRLEDLTPDSDLAPFMRAGIPATLRNAALRRMWALDPAIRDRVGDALDYAYDWNVPGNVPGAGPLLASDDVPTMLRSIGGVPDAEPSSESQTRPRSEALEQPDSGKSQLPSGPQPPQAAELSEPPDPREARAHTPPEPAPKEVAQTRRHGGATPF